MTIPAIRSRVAVISALCLMVCGTASAQPPGPPPPPPPGNVGSPRPMPIQPDALGAIGRAHDSVSQAASFATIAKDAEGIALGPLVAQSKTAYQEALSRYQASDLVGARELATAANDVSRAVVELATNATRASAQVPQPPPAPNGINDEAFRANDELARAGRTILEAQGSLSAYGDSIPAPAATEARGLLTTSQQLQQRGHTLLTQNQARDASAVARAADALAHAATHLQNRYLIAAGLIPPEPAPPGPPPPPGGRGRGRGPGW